jgi:hypothetical protein
VTGTTTVTGRVRALVEELRAGGTSGPGRIPGAPDPDAAPADPDAAAAGAAAELTARGIVAAIGFELSQGQVRSPQGRSAGMFSRRLAHIRIDLAAGGGHPAAVICHELVHCVDHGPYDFDHPWPPTRAQARNALLAQLVACLGSQEFVSTVLRVAPGRGQLALARHVVRTLDGSPETSDFDAGEVADRVAGAVQTLNEARTAPAWRHRAAREVAVDRGAGVMWLTVGPAATAAARPPSPPASLAARLCREAAARFSDDPRFTDDLDRSRPVPGGAA